MRLRAMSRRLRKSPSLKGIARCGVATVGALIVTAAAQPAAASTIYTNRTSFEAALASFETETFSSDVANADSITFPSVSISSIGTSPATEAGRSNFNRVLGGNWDGQVRSLPDRDGYLAITWTFPIAVDGFGATWSGIGSGLTLTGNFDGTGDQAIDLSTHVNGFGFGFVGVIGSAQFSSIKLTTTADTDLIGSDGVTIGLVPEPSTALLLASGLLAMAVGLRPRTRRL
jgi:hypothetical protein